MKIKTLLGVLLFSVFYLDGFSQPDHVGAGFNPPPHPRILLRKGEETAIKNRLAKEPVWQGLHEAIVKECAKMIDLPPVERIQIGRRLLDKSREALRRIFYLSYAYRITSEQKYLERAEKELLAVSAFTDWNPSHFLDVAEMTMAVAIGYDWLHDHLSPEARAVIKNAILKKGIEPSLESKYNGWLNAEHNWNQVCNAGMTYGAMAIYEDQPELAKKIINRAIESIKKPMMDYGPDGAYPEGYGYWGYGTSFNVMFLSALEKLLGNDFGLSSMPGFLNSARYLQHMTGPTGKPFNYSDAGSGNGGLQPAMFWMAARLKDPSVLWVELHQLKTKKTDAFVKDRLLPATIIWSEDISTGNIRPPRSTTWSGGGKSPVALMRTSWTDSNAIYVGLKGGSPSVNHAHMDIGSFVMDADGIRWAMDFGMQDYHSLESAGVQLWGRDQKAQRWKVFRYNNFVHNTLTVDSQYQNVKGHAPVISHSSRPSFMNAVTRLDEVYKDQLAKATRGIAIVDKSYVVVRDEVKALNKETVIRWTLLTPASVRLISSNSAELTRDGKTLILMVQSPAKITMKTWSTESPNSYDAPNPGTVLVGFETIVPANTSTALQVILVPGKAGKKSSGKIPRLDQWPREK